jgi:hypothetical protein
VVSLVNKMSGTKMGDRYHRSKPLKSDEKREKRQKRDEAQQKFKVSSQLRIRIGLPTSVADPGCLSRIPDPTFSHPGST